MKNIHILLIAGATLLIVAFIARSGTFARKNAGEPMSSAMRAAMTTPQLSTEDAQYIAQNYATAHTTKSGLRYIVHAPGEGQPAQTGKRVTVHYTGMLLNGKTFDSSRERNEPFVFTLGQDRVIEGWVEGVGGMKKGERRTLIIPYWLGYGESGKGGVIPPKATLIFDVEVLDIQ